MNAHVGEVGALWATQGGSDTGFVLSDAGRIRNNLPNPTREAVHYASGQPPTPDYAVEAVIHVFTLAEYVGIGGRAAPSSRTLHDVGRRRPASLLGTAKVGQCHWHVTRDLPGGVYAWRRLHGQTGSSQRFSKVFVGGLEVITASDSYPAPSTVGRAAVVGFGAVANSAGFHIDRSIAAAAPAAPDTQAPTMPTGLVATAESSTRIALTWTGSTDNVGVTEYRVYRNGGLVGTAAGPGFTDTGLVASTAYSYRATAIDAVPNESGQSAPAGATTLAPAGVDAGAAFTLTLDAGSGTAAPTVRATGTTGRW